MEHCSCLTPDDVPDWVPPAVGSLALVMPVGNADVQRRLLTDPRMKRVWQTLRGQKICPKALETLSWEQRLGTWGLPEACISPSDRACAAFYASAVQALTFPHVVTRAQAKNLARPWLSAAALCRKVLEHEPAPRINPELAKALETVGPYFEREGRLREQKGSPWIAERSSKARGDDEARARVRALAPGTHAIFGSYLYGTLATVVTVALQIEPKITPKSVANWCADLPPS
jgi:hypothetical protein